jgi:hypothetical protein
LTPPDGADGFGGSVAVSGSTAVVGANGVAYVFVQNGTAWSQQAELTPSDGAVGFGNSVAVSGGTAVVGSSSDPSKEGAAYVFQESGGTWSQQAELTAAHENFGYSVAVDGSTIVVGAPAFSYHKNNYRGAAYVFVQIGGKWSRQVPHLTPSDGAQGDEFGISAAVSGSTAVVGASLDLAYVFGSSAPPYTLSAAPSSLTVAQGEQGTSTVTITPASGFSGSVSFSASDLPSGVTAAFNPNPATKTSTLTLTASDTATVGTAQVMVTGTSGNLTQTARVALTVASVTATLSLTSLSFSDQAVNTTSAAKTVSLQNNGTGTLTINDITISGSFAISKDTCGSTLRAGKKCKVEVTFTPTQLGAATGTLTFADNATNSPQTVSLTGTGIAQTTLTPTSLTFAETEVGDTSDAMEVTLTNNLHTTVTGISYSTTGPFSVSSSKCSTTLDKGKSCTIDVTFSPTQSGTATGTLSVSDSANNSPQIVSLSGTGTSEAVYVSPTSLDFGDQSVGTTSNPMKVDLFNKGSESITVTSVTATGDFSITENYCTDGVKPNTHCYVDVVFSPTQSGALSGTLTFVDNATGSPQTASLSGTGD